MMPVVVACAACFSADQLGRGTILSIVDNPPQRRDGRETRFAAANRVSDGRA